MAPRPQDKDEIVNLIWRNEIGWWVAFFSISHHLPNQSNYLIKIIRYLINYNKEEINEPIRDWTDDHRLPSENRWQNDKQSKLDEDDEEEEDPINSDLYKSHI